MKIREIIVESEELNEGYFGKIAAMAALSLAATGVNAQGLEKTEQGQLAICAGVDLALAKAHVDALGPGRGDSFIKSAQESIKLAKQGGLPEDVLSRIVNSTKSNMDSRLDDSPGSAYELTKARRISNVCFNLREKIQSEGWDQKITRTQQSAQPQQSQGTQPPNPADFDQVIDADVSGLGKRSIKLYAKENANGMKFVSEDGKIVIYWGKSGDVVSPTNPKNAQNGEALIGSGGINFTFPGNISISWSHQSVKGIKKK